MKSSESYLSRCAESLLSGGDYVEIIIINDGSTDGTLKIAQTFAPALALADKLSGS